MGRAASAYTYVTSMDTALIIQDGSAITPITEVSFRVCLPGIEGTGNGSEPAYDAELRTYHRTRELQPHDEGRVSPSQIPLVIRLADSWAGGGRPSARTVLWRAQHRLFSACTFETCLASARVILLYPQI